MAEVIERRQLYRREVSGSNYGEYVRIDPVILARQVIRAALGVKPREASGDP